MKIYLSFTANEVLHLINLNPDQRFFLRKDDLCLTVFKTESEPDLLKGDLSHPRRDWGIRFWLKIDALDQVEIPILLNLVHLRENQSWDGQWELKDNPAR